MAQALTVKHARRIIQEASGDPRESELVKCALEVLRQDKRDRVFQGQKAYVDGLARIENPYHPGTYNYLTWAEGWDAAWHADRREP